MAKTMLLDNSEAKPKAGMLWTKKILKWKCWSEWNEWQLFALDGNLDWRILSWNEENSVQLVQM